MGHPALWDGDHGPLPVTMRAPVSVCGTPSARLRGLGHHPVTVGNGLKVTMRPVRWIA